MRVLLALLFAGAIVTTSGFSESRTANQANGQTAFGPYAPVQITPELHTLTLLAQPATATQPDPTLVADTEINPESAEMTEIPTTISSENDSFGNGQSLPEVEAAAAPEVQPVRDKGVPNGPNEMVLVTFYYCRRTVDKPDDGGGYCGHTASGVAVHPGTAACASSKLHRQFVFADDPQNLIFTCEDTGSGVGNGHVDIWYMTSSEGYSSELLGVRNIIWQD